MLIPTGNYWSYLVCQHVSTNGTYKIGRRSLRVHRHGLRDEVGVSHGAQGRLHGKCQVPHFPFQILIRIQVHRPSRKFWKGGIMGVAYLPCGAKGFLHVATIVESQCECGHNHWVTRLICQCIMECKHRYPIILHVNFLHFDWFGFSSISFFELQCIHLGLISVCMYINFTWVYEACCVYKSCVWLYQ